VEKILDRLLRFANDLGNNVIRNLNIVGDFVVFGVDFLTVFFKKELNREQLSMQMYIVSVKSIGIILLTGAFAGLALALQSYIGFARVQAEQFTGLVATLGMVRELGPVLTGLLVSAKTGSAITAEIGTMKITEQIDALKTLRIDPMSYLIIPRILATTIMLPFMTMFAMFFGIISSFILCVKMLMINQQSYVSIIQEYLRLNDITGGLIKSVVFGFIISWVGTYMGYMTIGGAREVGISTTKSVVIGSILILVSNYMLSAFLYSTGIS
jgi:phospholipid/cholesterol/gamma-HCH transport system permease protein